MMPLGGVRGAPHRVPTDTSSSWAFDLLYASPMKTLRHLVSGSCLLVLTVGALASAGVGCATRERVVVREPARPVVVEQVRPAVVVAAPPVRETVVVGH
jgi:hypothetical protein